MGRPGVEGAPGTAPGVDDALGASTLLDGERPDGDGPTSGEGTARLVHMRWLAAGTLAVAAAAVLVVVLLGSGSGVHHDSNSGVPAGDTTAAVTRRTLSESSTVDGTLGYGSTLELYDRLAGTFTWLPSVGAVIVRGGVMWRIDNRPIVLMYGSVPAYRMLKQGVGAGPDVSELNQNLIDLGFDPYGEITDDESFGEATTVAVKRWQKVEGLSQTGEVELGRVVFAPGARRVTAVKVTLGQDPPGGAAATSSPTTPAATTPSPANTPTANKSPGKKPGSQSPGKANGSPGEGKETPAKEARAKEEPAKEEPAKESPGRGSPSSESGAGAGEVALTTTSTQQIVQLKVKPEQQQLARLGEAVIVLLPGGGQTGGYVTQVGTVATESKGSGNEERGSPAGEGGESTIPVTITLDRPVARLDEAPVSVQLVKGIHRNVLTVPATALIATAGGGYAVEALKQDRRVTVPVTPSMFAGGYVEVQGAGVREGMIVIESQ